jgi:hypothetical protein
MTDHPNVRPIDPSDRRFVEGAVEFVPLHRAMPLRGRSAALRAEPLRVSGLRPAAAIAVRFLRFNAIALTLGFVAGLLAVLIPALVIAQVVS